MRVILSAAGRAFLRTFAVTFLTFAAGILAAPNYRQAAALATAASLAAIVAAVRAVRVFVPQLSTAIAGDRFPVAYAEVIITVITTFLVGFIALIEGVLSAPDLESGKAAAVAGILAVLDGLVRVIQSALTPGEPGPAGIQTPPQPVPPAALPTPMASNTP